MLNKLPHYHTPALSNPGYWSLRLCFLSPSQVKKRQFVATAFQKLACHIGTQFTSGLTSTIHDETYTHDAKCKCTCQLSKSNKLHHTTTCRKERFLTHKNGEAGIHILFLPQIRQSTTFLSTFVQCPSTV